MNISNTVQITQLPQGHEASSLRSPRDSDSINKLWKKLTEVVNSLNKSNQIISQMTREFKKIESRGTIDFEMHPFKIYTLPDELRPTTDSAQYTGSANWRTVRVRGGLVLTQLVSTSSFVNGTDMMQNYSYYNFLPSASVGNYDIQVPLNQPEYFFWIENSSSNAYYLRYDSNPTNTGSIGNPNGWLNFPSASTNTYIPIGYADTNTSGSINVMYIRQFLDTDVIATGGSGSGGWNWRGTFNTLNTYNYQDVTTLLDGSINAGMWLYVGITGSLGSINAPTFPQPSTTGGTDYWQRIPPLNSIATNCNGSVIYYDGFNN